MSVKVKIKHLKPGTVYNIKSEDYDDLVDDMMCLGVETDEEARKHVDGYPWEKVIIVRITTP